MRSCKEPAILIDFNKIGDKFSKPEYYLSVFYGDTF